ncbi:TPA: hypothetical protein N0F65_010158 [Lagenidium giganteum]|uniref:Uncharacterized protein n=1 Tax=Lagenidium giganteum TaxID=4803 RepID=A0AAV2Z485_9STRA|nr:TPA: hypothetical protein N0F65_010158 [Lagenidium giganteum]
MSEKLRPDADIVNNVALESGIVKIIRGEKLSTREAAEASGLKSVQVFMSSLISRRAFKKQKRSHHVNYIDLRWIPSTSNVSERFFVAKLVYSDLRKSLDADTLEVLLFLLFNRDMWNVNTIQEIRGADSKNRKE